MDSDFKYKGNIIIPHPYSIVFNDNKFLFDSYLAHSYNVSSTSILNYAIPWIYSNTSTTDNCMSSNIFYNYAILIESGSLFSCKHPNILNNNHTIDCFVSLGAPNNEFTNKTQFISDSFLFNNVGYAIMIDSVSSEVLIDYAEFIDYNT
eukprot:228388_1